VTLRYPHLIGAGFAELVSTAGGYGIPFRYGLQAMTSDTGSRALGVSRVNTLDGACQEFCA
jgi:hypothetical protein